MNRVVVPEDLLRTLTPRVLGVLVRRFGHFDLAEEATQDALLAAARQWPVQGVPDNPFGWLVTVAVRRLTDTLRSEQARLRRQSIVGRQWVQQADHATTASAGDDSLTLLVLCAHPSLSQASQVALTLKAVGGLSVVEIARAFMVSEATMTRRLTRAKSTLRDSGATFTLPSPQEMSARLDSVLYVLYLIFNEGYAATSGKHLLRVDLTNEAIRLTRMVHQARPEDPEVAGLLALMLLTDARRTARISADGALVTMADQDRSRWDRGSIDEGIELISGALPRGHLGRFQILGVINALHCEAATAADTDWDQILAFYGLLRRIDRSPVVALNQAVAIGLARSPEQGLAALEPLEHALGGDHRFHAVRGHLLQLSGRSEEARVTYDQAAAHARSIPMKRHLRNLALNLSEASGLEAERRPDEQSDC